jgi:hypothetical protein
MIDIQNDEDLTPVQHTNCLNNKLNIKGETNLLSESNSYRSTIDNEVISPNENKIMSLSALERRQSQKDLKKRMIKANIDELTDDTHECIRCLRAIMNHQYGLNVVFANQDAINSIALCLKHKQFRYILNLFTY